MWCRSCIYAYSSRRSEIRRLYFMIRNSSRLIDFLERTEIIPGLVPDSLGAISLSGQYPSAPGVSMPERGIGWFDPLRLENYLAGQSAPGNSRDLITLIDIDSPPWGIGPSAGSGLISIDGLTLERAGNLMNSSRKSHDKITVGLLPADNHNFTHYFPINNRRAIIGHKLTISFTH